MAPTATMLRELRSLRLRLDELVKQDEEALAAERRICETRLELAESAMKLKKPLMTCLMELGYPPIVAGGVLDDADTLKRDASQRLDQLKPLLPSFITDGLAEIEREIEKELEQWR